MKITKEAYDNKIYYDFFLLQLSKFWYVTLFSIAPSKGQHNFEWNNQDQFPKTCKNNTDEKADQSRAPVKRSIRIGLSRRAKPQPLHPHYPR